MLPDDIRECERCGQPIRFYAECDCVHVSYVDADMSAEQAKTAAILARKRAKYYEEADLDLEIKAHPCVLADLFTALAGTLEQIIRMSTTVGLPYLYMTDDGEWAWAAAGVVSDGYATRLHAEAAAYAHLAAVLREELEATEATRS